MPKIYAAGDPVTATDINAIIKVAGLYAASSGGSDTYAITLSPAAGSYVAGDKYMFKADVGNTGAATLNVNGLGAKTIKHLNGDDLVTGDIIANQFCIVIYDGTNMVLLNPNVPAFASGVLSSVDYTTNGTANNDETVTTGFTPRLIIIDFFIQGHTASIGTNAYNGAKGFAVYNGTTLIFASFEWSGANTDNAGPASVASISTIANQATAPTIGTAPSDTASAQMVLSIASVSATGLVVRKASSSNSGNNHARFQGSYRVWR